MDLNQKISTNNNNNNNFFSFLDYSNLTNNFHSVATSAIDSITSMRPMFELKNFNSSETNNYYTHIFGFEKLFESHDYVDLWQKWMNQSWKLSMNISLLYITLVFCGRFLMRNRAKYELRLPLIIWNIMLATFSIAGTIRSLPDFIRVLTTKGVVHSVCNQDYAYGITGFWSLMFILSKLPELIDTLFIVLRKQELIFLHWYHHATVLMYCWFSYKDLASTGRWFMTMNYLVHSLMYSYYALKAMRIRVPQFVSKLITTGQILQMIAGCYVNYVAYSTKVSGEACGTSDENIKYSSLMYFSYFVLFFDFFVKAYISGKKRVNKNESKGQSSPNNGLMKKVN